jgi:signal transduction histidine kinase
MESLTSAAVEQARGVVRPRILCVDDEPDLLAALCDVLHKRFDVTGANSGREGLRLLIENGPFAVVMSDFAMPGMNGAEFLAQACVAAPDTVRLLLTGHASARTALAAVNDGHVYRLLTKPCPPVQLLSALEDAVDQCRMATADCALLERKLESLSEHLLRAERLASLGTLAGVVGHELNDVVTTLNDTRQLIETDVAQGRLPSRQDLAVLKHTGERLAVHSRSLLRLGQRRGDDEPRGTDLRAAAREVVETLRRAGLLRHVQVQLGPSSPPVVARIGRTDIEQVLVNLVKNAVEALSETSREQPLIQISVTSDTAVAICIVSDNASGVSEANLPLIFEPYYSTKPADRGAGLGLYAVRQIVRGAGGGVSVDSTEGRGTSFMITLPLTSDEAPGS